MADPKQHNLETPAAETAPGATGPDDTEGATPDTGLPADAGGTVSTPESASMLGGPTSPDGYKMDPGGAGDMSGGTRDKQDTTGYTSGEGRFGTGS